MIKLEWAKMLKYGMRSANKEDQFIWAVVEPPNYTYNQGHRSPLTTSLVVIKLPLSYTYYLIIHATPSTHILRTIHIHNSHPSHNPTTMLPSVFNGSKRQLLALVIVRWSKKLPSQSILTRQSSQDVIKHQGQHQPLHKLAPPGSLLLHLREQRLLNTVQENTIISRPSYRTYNQ
jgi:hypothetical protein